MLKNKKLQIRLSEELLKFCQQKAENVSLFIRNIVREKMEQGLDSDDLSNTFEIRARTPYIYFATIHRIIDGDTLSLDIDLGFFTQVRAKVRLAGIDAQALSTPEGKKAKQFLETELTNANLVIESRKKEKYGRYLCYIFYHQTHTEFDDIIRHGKLINDELIKTGFAVQYRV